MSHTTAFPGPWPRPFEGGIPWLLPLPHPRWIRLRDAILQRVASEGATQPPPAAEELERRPAFALDPDHDLLVDVFEEYPRGTRWFGVLVERHWSRAWACCMSILLDPHDAEEAVQDTFLKVHRYLPSFRAESRFGTWLARIAQYAALDHLEKRRRRARRLEEVADDPVLRDRWSPSASPDPARIDHDLRNALGRLDPTDRMVLVLHDLNGVPFDEIAEIMDASAAALRMRASRARARLRERLRRAGRSAA